MLYFKVSGLYFAASLIYRTSLDNNFVFMKSQWEKCDIHFRVFFWVLTYGFPHTIFLKLCVHKDLFLNKLFSEFERFYRILGFCNFSEKKFRANIFLYNESALLRLTNKFSPLLKQQLSLPWPIVFYYSSYANRYLTNCIFWAHF